MPLGYISIIVIFALYFQQVVAFKPARLEFEVVLWASKLSTEVQATIISCPYNVSVIGLGQDWGSNGYKLNLALDFVRKQINPEKVLLFADSHDALFQGGTDVCPSADSYASAYWNHQADIIFQADGGCGWASTEICGEYPDQPKPFINSGVLVASVEALRSVLETFLVPLQNMNSVPSHDQGFWHILYGRQQKLFREGRSVIRTIAVDYGETLAGTSLTHSVWNASEVYEHAGFLAYTHKESHHKIGCVIHAPGQNANLISKGIMMQIRAAFKPNFVANHKHYIRLSKFMKLGEAVI